MRVRSLQVGNLNEKSGDRARDFIALAVTAWEKHFDDDIVRSEEVVTAAAADFDRLVTGGARQVVIEISEPPLALAVREA